MALWDIPDKGEPILKNWWRMFKYFFTSRVDNW